MTTQSGFNADHRIQFGCGLIVIGILAATGASVGYERFAARKAVASALDSVVFLQEDIAAHWREHQQLPTALRETLHGASPNMRNVSSVEWDSAGELTIRFDSVIQDRMNIDDEPTIVLKATVLETGVVWDCSFGTVTNWYRPEHCRMSER